MSKVSFILSKKFGTCFAIAAGAIFGGLLYSIGQNIGEYHGIEDTNNRYQEALNKLKEEYSHKEEPEN